MRREIERDVISRASNRAGIAICLARLPMSPGPSFADGTGQERRGAAALKSGGCIGNVTTPGASLSREGICGSVDSRGSLAGRIESRLTVAGQRRSRTGFPCANLQAHYAAAITSQPLIGNGAGNLEFGPSPDAPRRPRPVRARLGIRG